MRTTNELKSFLMKILGIETSCDETAISIIEATGTNRSPALKILSGVVHSQAALHAEWLGVVPNLAKREHSKNLVPVLQKALKEGGLFVNSKFKIQNEKLETKIQKILLREPGLAETFLNFVPNIETPEIDLIAVTYGPGLEPALWTGINFAKALGLTWRKPVIPINHMEGHALSALLPDATPGKKFKTKPTLPAIALLISGGHTELVLIKNLLKYKVIGSTRDDAVGEAFDKVARMLGLPYPGGPEISRLAEKFQDVRRLTSAGRESSGAIASTIGGGREGVRLPRPMINSGDLDFSFSGLKTAVLYLIKKLQEKDALILEREEVKSAIANEFEEAVVEVLISKTKKALEQHVVKTLIIGGGVIANKKIRLAFQNLISEKFPKIKLLIPHRTLATDNATMIGIAAYFRWLGRKNKKSGPKKNFNADGNLVLK